MAALDPDDRHTLAVAGLVVLVVALGVLLGGAVLGIAVRLFLVMAGWG